MGSREACIRLARIRPPTGMVSVSLVVRLEEDVSIIVVGVMELSAGM